MSSNSKKSSNKRRQPTPTPSVVSSSDYEGEDNFLFGGTAEQSFTSSLPGGLPTYHIQHPPTTTVPSMPPPVEDPNYESSSSSATAAEDVAPFPNNDNERKMSHTRSTSSSLTSETSKHRSQSHSISSMPTMYNHGPLIPHSQCLRKISLEIRQPSGGLADDSLQPPLHRHPKVLYSIELQSLTERQQEDIRRRGGLSSLIFTKSQLDSMQRLFLVLDTENKGFITFQQAEDFVYSRCPVVYRRDQVICMQMHQHNECTSYMSSTLVEAWRTIVDSGLPKDQLASLIQTPEGSESTADTDYFICQSTVLGLEGWMILLRLIAFCQYHEAKQFFSAKRLGNTMVVVDVPRDRNVIPLTMDYLLQFELKFDYRKVLNGESSKKSKSSNSSVIDSSHKPVNYCPPMPELDLNHSGMAAQEDTHIYFGGENGAFRLPAPTVQIEALGSYSDAAWKAGKVDLNLSLTSTEIARSRIDLRHVGVEAGLMSTSIECTTSTTTVRRSLDDLTWLNDTFVTHKKLGGTLCGRILPSFFPEENSHRVTPTPATDTIDFLYPTDKASGGGSSTTSAMFSYVKSVGKTVLGTIQKTSGFSLTSSGTSSRRKGSGDFGTIGQEARLKRLNRCTNYLLEHAGLQRSFPLNSFLKASKTGLEATKRIVEDSNKSLSGASHTPSSNRGDGGGTVPALQNPPGSVEAGSGHSDRTGQVSGTKLAGSSVQQTESSGYVSLNWIRNAAQAAVTLKVHGILNATGMSSYSARLQHASLPDIDYHQSYRGMSTQNLHPSHLPIQNLVKGEIGSMPEAPSSAVPQQGVPGSDAFESNVTTVACGLDDEYDLLPSPQKGGRKISIYEENENWEAGEGAGSSSASGTPGEKNAESTVNATVESLRGVIKSVDDNLQRCIVAHDKISITSRARAELCSSIVRALDANSQHGDLSDGFSAGLTMDEQYFLRGMTDLMRSHELQYQADSEFEEEFSWQTSLSAAAVSAANDVRAAARAAKRAAGAKRAAEAAAQSALKSFERQLEVSTGPSETTEIAQSRYEDARSRAMNAAIVAHETTTVKRKAAMALAHDVRQWSDHRRRELFKACIALSKMHRDAASASANAWTVLKDAATGPMESEHKFHTRVNESRQSKSISRKDLPLHKPPNLSQQTVVSGAIVDNFYDTSKTTTGTLLPVEPSSQAPEDDNYAENRSDTNRQIDVMTSAEDSQQRASFGQPTTMTSQTMNYQSSSNPFSKEGFLSAPPPSFSVQTGLSLTAEDAAASSSNQLPPIQLPYSLDSEYRDIIPGPGAGLLDNAFHNFEEHPVSTGYDDTPPTDTVTSHSNLSTSPPTNPAEHAVDENKNAPSLESEDSAKPEERNSKSRAQDRNIETDEASSLVKSMDGLDISGEGSTEIVEKEGASFDQDDEFEGHTGALRDRSTAASGDGGGGGTDNNAMTESMQSLVDGLMAWGNRYDPADDIQIPSGLVASILEDGNQFDDQEGSDAEIIQ